MTSCHEDATPGRPNSTANRREVFPGNPQSSLFQLFPDTPPGSLNDGAQVRFLLADSIRVSNKSRAHIADEMTHLSGRKVTERMLNSWTAESREDHPFPAELERAFCKATGNDRLMKFRAELAGYKVIDKDEQGVLEFGRQYLVRETANQFIADFMQTLGRRK